MPVTEGLVEAKPEPCPIEVESMLAECVTTKATYRLNQECRVTICIRGGWYSARSRGPVGWIPCRLGLKGGLSRLLSSTPVPDFHRGLSVGIYENTRLQQGLRYIT